MALIIQRGKADRPIDLAMADAFLHLGTGLKWTGVALSPLLLFPLVCLLYGRRLHSTADHLASFIDRISSAALAMAMACGVVIVVTQLLVVILRYVFGLSFSWLSEIVVYGFAAMFLLASASALRENDHVRVDILRPRFGVRGRAAAELVGIYLFLFPICALVLWSAISPSFVRSWMNFEASRESDGLPILFLFRTLIPLFAVLLMAQGLSQAIKAAQTLTGLRAPEDPQGAVTG
ncbi:MAG: TRAP transporter small permease subunit [Pseudomonadota bacterium]